MCSPMGWALCGFVAGTGRRAFDFWALVGWGWVLRDEIVGLGGSRKLRTRSKAKAAGKRNNDLWRKPLDDYFCGLLWELQKPFANHPTLGD